MLCWLATLLSRMLSRAFCAMRSVSRALSLFWLMPALISSIDEETSSADEACEPAPSLIICEAWAISEL